MIHLECARGVASLIVVVHHCCLAFYPGIRAAFWHGGLEFTPGFFLLNGAGAVTFFFMLSGFVLTFGFYKRFSPEALLAAIIKRLPRLMIPAGASIFLGFLVLQFGGGWYHAAAAYSGSQWLDSFGNAEFPPDFVSSVLDAARQSLFVFLRPNDFYYNSSLWTMVYEFYGSLVVFGIVLLAVRRTPTARRTLLLHATLAIIMTFICAVLVPFVAGSYLAYRSSLRQPGFELSPRTTAVLFVGAVIGFSTDAWLANTLAALFVMLGLLGSRPLAARLSGRVGVVLGTLSFPLYLVHALVILSASSFVYARATALAAPEYAVLALTLVTTILLSAIVAWPFVLLDSFCLARINAAASRLAIRLMAPYQRGIGALPPT